MVSVQWAVVEVAVGLVSQSHGLTPGSGGHDVAALVRDDRHGKPFLPPPPIPENKRILFIGLWGGFAVSVANK